MNIIDRKECTFKKIIKELLRVFATNSIFIIPLYLQPHGVKPLYFKPRVFDLTEYIKGCKDIGIKISEYVTKT